MTGVDVLTILTFVVVLNLWGAASVVIISFGGKNWCAMLGLGLSVFWLIVLLIVEFGEEFQPAVSKLTH